MLCLGPIRWTYKISGRFSQGSRLLTVLSVRGDGQVAFMALALADTGLASPGSESLLITSWRVAIRFLISRPTISRLRLSGSKNHLYPNVAIVSDSLNKGLCGRQGVGELLKIHSTPPNRARQPQVGQACQKLHPRFQTFARSVSFSFGRSLHLERGLPIQSIR